MSTALRFHKAPEEVQADRDSGERPSVVGLPLESTPVREAPPLGVVPAKMDAWVIRRERQGEPTKSFQREMMPTPEPGPNEVLVYVMAAGINYNGVWAGAGKPVSVFDVHKKDFHICGSDASGIVWKVGSAVTKWKVGDEVIAHCNQSCGECGECNGGDPLACENQRIWGYETPQGSFAQFCLLQSQQVLRKPPKMSWEESASYGLTYFTAYRMLVDQAQVKPGENVLIWGASGGLGVFAVQLVKLMGGRAIAVVSSAEKGELVKKLGADGVINRKDFPNLAFKPGETPEQNKLRMDDTKKFGKAIWEIIGEKKGPDVVFEHVGRETFAASVFLCNKFGRIVICGATSGFDLTFDVRHLWMRQKRILGSHFANALECQKANDLIHRGMIKPVLTETYSYEEIPMVHEKMAKNQLKGTVSCLVGAPRTGLTNAADTLGQ